MAVDDSFKKQGAVPFKWEIKPGVPRAHHHLQHKRSMPPSSPPPPPQRAQSCNHHRSAELTSPKLKPPPAGLYIYSPVEPRARSFRSTSRIRSDRWRFDRPLITQPESVSTGCFFSPLLRRMPSRKRLQKPVIEPEKEPDYRSDLETLARWSLSSRKSLSPFRDSTTTTTSSSQSSHQSSPRLVSDAEWAGFGLF